jgi:hypothetical protein
MKPGSRFAKPLLNAAKQFLNAKNAWRFNNLQEFWRTCRQRARPTLQPNETLNCLARCLHVA